VSDNIAHSMLFFSTVDKECDRYYVHFVLSYCGHCPYSEQVHPNMGIRCPYYEHRLDNISVCIFDFRDARKRGLWTEDAMRKAVLSVLMAVMSKKASREFGVPRGTLQRHIKNAQKGVGVKNSWAENAYLRRTKKRTWLQDLLIQRKTVWFVD